jgi:hypothetical protein
MVPPAKRLLREKHVIASILNGAIDLSKKVQSRSPAAIKEKTVTSSILSYADTPSETGAALTKSVPLSTYVALKDGRKTKIGLPEQNGRTTMNLQRHRLALTVVLDQTELPVEIVLHPRESLLTLLIQEQEPANRVKDPTPKVEEILSE